MEDVFPKFYISDITRKCLKNKPKFIVDYYADETNHPVKPTLTLKRLPIKTSPLAYLILPSIAFFIMWFGVHLIVGVISLLVALWFSFIDWKKYPIELQRVMDENTELESQHKNRIEIYESEKQFFWDAGKISLATLENKKEIRTRLGYIALKQLQVNYCNDLHPTDNLRGKSEDAFYVLLNQYFGENIKRDLEFLPIALEDSDLQFSNSKLNERMSFGYTPDFIYFDNRTNTYIDIEIDEPYIANGDPIHQIGNNKDYARNTLFVRKGWNVIRFSEFQILFFPKECCLEIAVFIFRLLEDASYLNIILRDNCQTRLPNQLAWTKKTSFKMFTNGYRALKTPNDRYRSIEESLALFPGNFSSLEGDYVFTAERTVKTKYDLDNSNVFNYYHSGVKEIDGLKMGIILVDFFARSPQFFTRYRIQRSPVDMVILRDVEDLSNVLVLRPIKAP